jgi:hypothetical protein
MPTVAWSISTLPTICPLLAIDPIEAPGPLLQIA